MLKKIRNVVIAVLAVLGVLFIILMLLPDDEEAADGGETQYAAEESVIDDDEAADIETEQQEQTKPDEETMPDAEDAAAGKDDAAADAASDNAGSDTEANTQGINTVSVNIPADEISDTAVKFKTMTLDNNAVTQDIFGEYDLTIVHVWGTYCGPCVDEMGDIGEFCRELPDNVGLVGIVQDVYDGIDRNADYAEEILKNADAEFVNLRVSDDVYDMVGFVRRIPTTFFVDSEGHIVGGLIEGSGVDRIRQRLDGYID